MRENLQPVLCYLGTSPVDFAWEKLQKLLHFVQRGRILLRCGSALALSLPSLGVSSLDLGRLFSQEAPFFLGRLFSWGPHFSFQLSFHARSAGPESRDSGFTRRRMSRNDGFYSAAA